MTPFLYCYVKQTISGYAASGGGRGIERVDVSIDGGKTWLEASRFHKIRIPYRSDHESSDKWAWVFFEITVDIPRGTQVVAKAVYSAANVQPENVQDIWNLRGVDRCCLDPSHPVSPRNKAFDTASEISYRRGAAPLFLVWKVKKCVRVGSQKQLKDAVEEVRAFIEGIIHDKKRDRRKQRISVKKISYRASLCESTRHYPPVALADDLLPDGTLVRAGDRVTYSPYGIQTEPWFIKPASYHGGSPRKVCPYKFPVFQADPWEKDCIHSDELCGGFHTSSSSKPNRLFRKNQSLSHSCRLT
ncbi:ubiquitin-conjugating enzyme E2 7-like [Hibiscus syriacus]|uniref:Sulfite oxidase n=1 Tax=Hibiscus syriacus TaxID=106335 RepID=A0A6A3A182_HIBSY|nr:ubiquitin-conjugating enzyme E2 7-like [Hibiscus syriacus]